MISSLEGEADLGQRLRHVGGGGGDHIRQLHAGNPLKKASINLKNSLRFDKN